MNRSILRSASALTVTLAVLLSACSSGGGGDEPAVSASPMPPASTTPTPSPAATGLVDGTDVPLTATQDSAGATGFAQQLAAMPDDSNEPLALGDVTLASSEVDEPAVVN